MSVVRWEEEEGEKKSVVESGVSRVLEVKKGRSVSGGNLSVGLALVENFRIKYYQYIYYT